MSPSPVPIVKAHCNNGFCGMEAFPLRMSISLTGHKSQGVTIARGEQFHKVVIHLPADAKTVPVGLKMTMGSRLKLIADFFFANKDSELNKN